MQKHNNNTTSTLTLKIAIMFFVWWLKSGRDNIKLIIWLSLFGFVLDMPKKCSIFGCKTNYHSEKKNENLVVEENDRYWHQ